MRGGNAIDAAVAVSAALGLVEPCMPGQGGVGHVLVYLANERRVRCLDFVGPSPVAIDPAGDHPARLMDGVAASVVPGAVGGWLAALDAYGALDRAVVFAPAIRYAEDGSPVTPRLVSWLERSASLAGGLPFRARHFPAAGPAPAIG